MNNNNDTINLEELGFKACGKDRWVYIDDEDFGSTGYERWLNPKTNKVYEIRWTRERHIKEAREG